MLQLNFVYSSYLPISLAHVAGSLEYNIYVPNPWPKLSSNLYFPLATERNAVYQNN